MKLPLHWDEKHLIAFLYIFIAHSDFVETPEETAAVKEGLDDLFLDYYGLSEAAKSKVVSEVKAWEMEMSEEDKMDTIQGLAKRIQLDSDTYQYIVNQLNEIAHSDKYVSVEEHSLMYYIRLQFKKDYPKR